MVSLPPRFWNASLHPRKKNHPLSMAPWCNPSCFWKGAVARWVPLPMPTYASGSINVWINERVFSSLPFPLIELRTHPLDVSLYPFMVSSWATPNPRFKTRTACTPTALIDILPLTPTMFYTSATILLCVVCNPSSKYSSVNSRCSDAPMLTGR